MPDLVVLLLLEHQLAVWFHGPSYVTINLSLVGGKNYSATDGPMYLCETYPLLISPSGTELLIGAGESGICLPFMSQSTLACVLTQSAG